MSGSSLARPGEARPGNSFSLSSLLASSVTRPTTVEFPDGAPWDLSIRMRMLEVRCTVECNTVQYSDVLYCTPLCDRLLEDKYEELTVPNSTFGDMAKLT